MNWLVLDIVSLIQRVDLVSTLNTTTLNATKMRYHCILAQLSNSRVLLNNIVCACKVVPGSVLLKQKFDKLPWNVE